MDAIYVVLKIWIWIIIENKFMVWYMDDDLCEIESREMTASRRINIGNHFIGLLGTENQWEAVPQIRIWKDNRQPISHPQMCALGCRLGDSHYSRVNFLKNTLYFWGNSLCYNWTALYMYHNYIFVWCFLPTSHVRRLVGYEVTINHCGWTALTSCVSKGQFPKSRCCVTDILIARKLMTANHHVTFLYIYVRIYHPD